MREWDWDIGLYRADRIARLATRFFGRRRNFLNLSAFEHIASPKLS
jgi:hypothetical protein